MIRPHMFAAAAAISALLATASHAATGYVQVFTETEASSFGNPFLDTVVVSGDTAYAILRDTTTGTVDGGEVVAFDGSTFSTVMTNSQWLSLVPTEDPQALNGAAVVGNKIRFVNSVIATNGVYEIDLLTGLPSSVLPSSTIAMAVGGTVQLPSQYETAPDGTIYATETNGDRLLAISPSPTNLATVEIPAASFSTSIGGVGVLGSTVYFGDNNTDTLKAWDTVLDVPSTVLTRPVVDALTGNTATGFNIFDIYAAPDGLVYFYESQSDYILSFDPIDPVNSLEVVLTKSQLELGPAGSSNVGQLVFYKGTIAWTVGGNGFYRAIPEPSSFALLGLAVAGGLVSCRRKM